MNTTTAQTMTMTTRQVNILWIVCHDLGSTEAVRMAAQAHSDLLRGVRDSEAVQWAATMFGQIKPAQRKAAEAQLAR